MNDMNESIITEEEEAVETEETVEETVEESLSAADVDLLKTEIEALKLQLEESQSMYDRLHGECIEFFRIEQSVEYTLCFVLA